MQPVNDDMDNLFRQAAENYPLNTQGADFDKLLQRMDAAGEDAPLKKENRRRYGWLLLLLLIPLSFVCRHYAGSGMEDKRPATVQQQDKEEQLTIYQKKITAAPNDKTAANKQEVVTDGAGIKDNTPTEPATPTLSNFPGSSAGQQNGIKETVQKNNTQPASEASTATTYHDAKQVAAASRKSNKKLPGKQNSSYSRADAENKAIEKRIKADSEKEKQLASGTALPATERGRQPDSLLQTDSSKLLANKLADTTSVATTQKVTAKDSTVSDSASLVKKQSGRNKKIKPFLYAGAVAGIDYSVVKSNQTAGTGYNAGVVAGYRFGLHWAVETGLSWAYKKYRAEGKYIDTLGLGIAGHTQVMNANGSCSILEIPLIVQYHFNSKGKRHWYAAAGLSSYLMKKEEYYYIGKRYNMVYYAEKEYTNSTQNWFSVLQLGGGYQLLLGKRSSLRAEPYLKLPLSKIGIAKLPLSSAGINIGYIRSL